MNHATRTIVRKTVGASALLAAVFLLVAIVISAVAIAQHGLDGQQGVFVLTPVAAVLLQVALVLLLRPSPRRSPHDAAAPRPGLTAAPDDRAQSASTPVDRSVRYRQWCCQFPFLRTTVALGLVALGVLIIVLTPNSGGNGPQGFLVLLPVLPGLYVFAVLLYLPYRIAIIDGVLTTGVVGVPRIGRLWRSLSVDLSAVAEWEVVDHPRQRPSQRRRALREARESGRPVRRPTRNVNNLQGPGGRHTLTIWPYPDALAGKDFPHYVMSGYSLRGSADLGYATGPVVIRTRHPTSLVAALTVARPEQPVR